MQFIIHQEKELEKTCAASKIATIELKDGKDEAVAPTAFNSKDGKDGAVEATTVDLKDRKDGAVAVAVLAAPPTSETLDKNT